MGPKHNARHQPLDTGPGHRHHPSQGDHGQSGGDLMRLLAAALIVGICGGCGGGGKTERAGSKTESVMAESVKNPPLSAPEPKALYSEAIAIARGSNDADLRTLRQKMGDGSFLAKLDTDDAYRGKMERLRVAGILQALSENKAPSARAVLTGLMSDKVFLSQRPRV